MLEGANMDEKNEGATAMERLCRELMDAVCISGDASYYWCDENNIYASGASYTECKRRARADIERRIAEARAEDAGVQPWSLGDVASWRDKARELDALRAECKRRARADIERRIAEARAEDAGVQPWSLGDVASWRDKARELDALRGAGRIVPDADIERRIAEARAEDAGVQPWSLGDVASWRDKARELDALRGAGRIVPDGLSWFCYEDGAPLLLGAEAWDSAGHRLRVVALSHKGRAAVRPWERGDGLSWFCYEDGAPLLLGAEAWDSAGHRLRVVALSHKGRAAVRPWERGDGRGARWVPVSSLRSERPDSWERLRGDAAKGSMEYWDCCSECYECPAKVDGETPDERYAVANCWYAMQLDIVARAERLAMEYWDCCSECYECPAKVDGETPDERYAVANCWYAMQLDIVARAERLAGAGE